MNSNRGGLIGVEEFETASGIIPGWDGWVGTNSGKQIGLSAVDLDEIDIKDIARGLANSCRFTGQLGIWYSVAEHCIQVAEILPKHLRLVGLLHDAAEAYISDLSSPIKRYIGEPYRKVEHVIAKAIGQKYGVGDALIDLPKAVKDADRIMLMTERDHLQDKPRNDWGEEYEDSVRIPGFYRWYETPEEAYKAYLAKFKEYSRGTR